MNSEPVVVATNLNQYYGEGASRRQILFDVNVRVQPGEIVIVLGPSGSGKTTLLTLIGALRSTQEGSLKVLGHELKGASEQVLVRVRRRIGYVFQAHNLLASLTAAQNVQMSARLTNGTSIQASRNKAEAALRAVGLGARIEHHPDQLSGGQKQRVAIARALVGDPKLILADEPTASLDKQSGRDVVDIMRNLAKEHGCAVLLVTHDNRILDVADRIIHLEDGKLTSFTNAVAANTAHMMKVLADSTRKGELISGVAELPASQFADLLTKLTSEFEEFLRVTEMSSNQAFDSLLGQLIETFTRKVGTLLEAEISSLFLIDEERGELWSKVAQGEGGKPIEIRIPITTGIAGRVARTGAVVNIEDAYTDPDFNRDVDLRTGFRTRSLLCVPIKDLRGRVFAVAQLLNKRGADRFDAADERRFAEFAGSIGVLLESWCRITRQRGSQDPSS